MLIWTAVGVFSLLLFGWAAEKIMARQAKRDKRAWLKSPYRKALFDEWLEDVEKRKSKDR